MSEKPNASKCNNNNNNCTDSILDTAEMRARYDAVQNQNDSNYVHSSKYSTRYLMKKGHEKERQRFVTNIFIRNEMKKLSYQKYIHSPFAFIDGIDKQDRSLNEFVYLNEIAPYDLEIIPLLQLINNNNYYTLSSQVLTDFYELNGITQVLFTPLGIITQLPKSKYNRHDFV